MAAEEPPAPAAPPSGRSRLRPPRVRGRRVPTPGAAAATAGQRRRPGPSAPTALRGRRCLPLRRLTASVTMATSSRAAVGGFNARQQPMERRPVPRSANGRGRRAGRCADVAGGAELRPGGAGGGARRRRRHHRHHGDPRLGPAAARRRAERGRPRRPAAAASASASLRAVSGPGLGDRPRAGRGRASERAGREARRR